MSDDCLALMAACVRCVRACPFSFPAAQYIAATGSEGRGGGNQTAAERVADLLKADEKGLDNAFGNKESAARKARPARSLISDRLAAHPISYL